MFYFQMKLTRAASRYGIMNLIDIVTNVVSVHGTSIWYSLILSRNKFMTEVMQFNSNVSPKYENELAESIRGCTGISKLNES